MSKFSSVIIFTASLFLLSCSSNRHDQKRVEAAMKHYDRLILHLDAEGISKIFMPDGNLGNMAVGRDSIKKFLASFKNIRVLSQASATSSIQITADTAIQKGSYRQSDIVGKDTVHVKGAYIATWRRAGKNNWLIQNMVTKPD